MQPDPPPSDPATPPATPPRPALGVNLFFRIAAALVLIFVVTIFALIAILFGDPAAPIAKFLDHYGMQLIVGEMIGILVVGALAMTVDRRQFPTMTAPEGRNDESFEA